LSLEDGLVGEYQHALDLPLHFGLEIERQIGAHARGERCRAGDDEDEPSPQPESLDPKSHDNRNSCCRPLGAATEVHDITRSAVKPDDPPCAPSGLRPPRGMMQA
jgi:hypothetical protein